MEHRRRKSDPGYDPFLDHPLALWLFDNGMAKYFARALLIVAPILVLAVVMLGCLIAWLVEVAGPLVLILPGAAAYLWAWSD